MAANDELTMSDLNLTHTNTDETVTPETFDLAAWIAGVTPVERTVTVYAHGHLFAVLSALEAEYNEAKAAVNVDDMRDAKDKMRTVANQIRASALDITVQGRSADWVQRFRDHNPGKKLPGFPIWVDSWQTTEDLEIQIESGELDDVPAWKMNFLRKNAQLFTDNAAWCRAWKTTSGVKDFPPSRRKLEWQAQDIESLWDCLMHFRPSGLRAKPPTYVPALVAITQTSIVGKKRRRLAPREAARLQGFPDEFSFAGQPDAKTYKQLGNGVNVGVVWNVLKMHCERDRRILESTASGRRILNAVDAAPASPDEAVRKLLTR